MFAQPRAPRPGGRRHRRATSSAAPTARGPRGSPSTPPRATSTSTSRTGETGFWTRLRRARAAGDVHLGRPATGSSPPASRATSPRRCPDARQVVLERLRPRAPGRAAGADERADPHAASLASVGPVPPPAQRHGLPRRRARGPRLASAPMADPATSPRRRRRTAATHAERNGTRPTRSRAVTARARLDAPAAPLARAGRPRARSRRPRRRHRSAAAAKRIAGAPDGRPRRPRPRLHPREPAARLAAASIWFRAEVRNIGNVPEDGPVLLVGNHSGGNLTPDTIVFTLAFYTYFGVERRLLPARPQPRPRLAVRADPAPLRHGGRLPRARAQAPSRPAPRCSSIPGGDWEVHRPSLAEREQGRLRRPQGLHPAGAGRRTCRSSPWSRSAARRPRSSSAAATGSRSCSGSTGCCA